MLYLQRYFKQALHISDPADKALTIHPIGTSVKSDECNKPANFVPHYNQRVSFSQTQFLVRNPHPSMDLN